MRSVRGGGVVAVVAAVVALAGCTSGEEPPSVLTSTDLGPGQWRGPFAEAADADVAARDSRCTSLRPFFLTDEGGGVVAQELSAWAAGETLVTVQVDRHQAGDADLRERLSTPELLEDCVEAAGEGSEALLADFSWAVDGAVLVTEETSRSGAISYRVDTAMTVTEDAFVAVQVSWPDDAEPGPDARSLASTAVERLGELSASEGGEG